MSQAEELLNGLTDEEMSKYVDNEESEPHIVIGKDRRIIIPDSLKRIAVQYDHDIETLVFDCPRFWDEHDMSQMAVYINYMRSDKYSDCYPVNDITVDGDIMHFSWTISRNVTEVAGAVSFLVCVKNVDKDGMETNHWNSEISQGAYVSEGMETEEQYVEQNLDLVTELLLRMSNIEKTLNDLGIDDVKDDDIPDYWREHLENKISTIKTLQDEGGKNCFSFVVFTDAHYGTNLGKRSPILAKKIMDECNIKYALSLGDAQDTGSAATLEDVKTQFELVNEMFSPLAENLLMTQGNHEGSYGEPLNGKTYPYNMTPEELYNRIYAITYKHQNVITDESGTAYFVDDNARKVRYILLNSHCNLYAENEDGSVKYNNMTHFRFTQSQYDFLVNKALVLEQDGWKIVIASHAPIVNAYAEEWGTNDNTSTTDGDHSIMRGLLKAFKNKTSYSAEWGGTANGGAGGYTNLFDTNGDGFYVGDSGNAFCTNWMPYNLADNEGQGTIYHIKGCKDNVGYINPHMIQFKAENGTESARIYCVSPEKWEATKGLRETADYDASVKTVRFQHTSSEWVWVRFEIDEPVPEDLIITANEPIIEGEKGYDTVSVSADFTNAKGEFVAYFSGHTHKDYHYDSNSWGIDVITTRSDTPWSDGTDGAEAGTTTEQSFDVFTVNTKTNTIYATKIGIGEDRTIAY